MNTHVWLLIRPTADFSPVIAFGLFSSLTEMVETEISPALASQIMLDWQNIPPGGGQRVSTWGGMKVKVECQLIRY